MEQFSATLRAWQPFFSTVATASATLVGLLFVSLSVYKGRDQPFPRGYLLRAQGSFADFLYVLMIGLAFLAPHEVPFGLAVALIVLGASRIVPLIRQALRTRHTSRATLADVLREYAIPALASFGLLFVGTEVLLGTTITIFALVLVIAALLTTGSWNAWLLLVQS